MVGMRGGRKPAPFVKPSITISEEAHGAQKRWVRAHPKNVRVGDIIQGQGLVVGVSEAHFQDPAETVYVFEMKNGSKFRASNIYHKVIAFTEAEGEPVG